MVRRQRHQRRQLLSCGRWPTAPTATPDSFWVSVDGLPDVQLDLPAASWGWVQDGRRRLNLATGKHTLKIKVREDGALHRQARCSPRTGPFTPTGLGGTALACNGLLGAQRPGGHAGQRIGGLSWNPVTGATSYTVKRSTTSGSGYMTVQSGITGTTSTTCGLNNGTQYFFVVSAVNAVGESPNSSEVPGHPGGCDSPGLHPTNVGNVGTAAGSWS